MDENSWKSLTGDYAEALSAAIERSGGMDELTQRVAVQLLSRNNSSRPPTIWMAAADPDVAGFLRESLAGLPSTLIHDNPGLIPPFSEPLYEALRQVLSKIETDSESAATENPKHAHILMHEIRRLPQFNQRKEATKKLSIPTLLELGHGFFGRGSYEKSTEHLSAASELALSEIEGMALSGSTLANGSASHPVHVERLLALAHEAIIRNAESSFMHLDFRATGRKMSNDLQWRLRARTPADSPMANETRMALLDGRVDVREGDLVSVYRDCRIRNSIIAHLLECQFIGTQSTSAAAARFSIIFMRLSKARRDGCVDFTEYFARQLELTLSDKSFGGTWKSRRGIASLRQEGLANAYSALASVEEARGAVSEALKWLESAQTNGGPNASTEIRRLREQHFGEEKPIVKYLRHCLEQESDYLDGAQKGVLWSELQSIGPDADKMFESSILRRSQGLFELADSLMRVAARAGSLAAIRSLANKLWKEDNLEEAARWWEDAIENFHDLPSIRDLGDYLLSVGDAPRAKQVFEVGANLDFPHALLMMGKLSSEHGEIRDWYTLLASHTEADARAEHLTSLEELGRLEECGGNLDQARRWYSRGANLGSSRCAMGLSTMAENRGDKDTAVHWRGIADALKARAQM